MSDSQRTLRAKLRALVHAVRKPAELAQRVGAPDAIFELASRVVSACTLGACSLRRYYLMAQPLAAMPRARPGRGGSIEVRRVTSDDAVVARFPRPRGEVMERFAAGSRCFVAEASGDLLGFLWLHCGPYADPEVCVTFTPSPSHATVWDFDLYVVPHSRAGLAFYRIWDSVSRELVAQGAQWSVSLVWAGNDESIRAHRRLGAYPIASGCHLRVGGLAVTFTARAPYVRIGRRGGAYARMTVAAQGARRYARFAR